MSRESGTPEVELASSGRAKARRGRPLIRYALYATIAAVVLIGAALIVATIVADAPLSESAKAPPPALREFLDAQLAGQTRTSSRNSKDADPLSAASPLPDDDAFRRGFRDAFFKADLRMTGIRQPKPADAQTAAFLASQRELLDRFYAWAEQGGVLSASDQLAFLSLMRMALADFELDWRDGRPAESLRIAQLLARLLVTADPHGPERYADALRNGAMMLAQSLQRWVEGGTVSPEAARVLQASVRQIAERSVADAEESETYWRSYAAARGDVVQELSSPWYSRTYGFSLDRLDLYPKIGDAILPVPNPFKVVSMAAGAIRARRRAPQILADWDRWYQASIDEALSDPSAVKKGRFKLPNLDPQVLLTQAPAAVLRRIEVAVLSQCNLLRAGLTVLQDPAARPPASIDIANDPLNPWRDPYTDAPLRLIERDGRIAIYSPGQTGGQVNEDALSLEDNDAVLLLPASPAPDGETSR